MPHPGSKIFREIYKKLHAEHVEPFKNLKKKDRPVIPVKVQERMDRNKRFIKELNNLKR